MFLHRIKMLTLAGSTRDAWSAFWHCPICFSTSRSSRSRIEVWQMHQRVYPRVTMSAARTMGMHPASEFRRSPGCRSLEPSSRMRR